MAVYKRPGVYIKESVLPNTVPVEDTPTLSSLIAPFAKGPTAIANLVTSWSEFTKTYGTLDAAYPGTFAAYMFYLNGGQNLLVNRVIASDAVLATKTLTDRAEPAVNTLRIDADNAGAWGNSIYIGISNNASDSTRFDVAVYFGGSTTDKLVEEFVGCSMDSADAKYVVPFISQVSNYISVTDLGSATTSPNDRPSVLAASSGALSSGANGSAPTAAQYGTALQKYDTVPFAIDVNAPAISDYVTDGVIARLINYASTRGDMFVVVDPASGSSVSTVATAAGTLDTSVKALYGQASSDAAIYYPWVTIPDPLAVVPGQTRTVAPGGAVLGMIARSDVINGPEKAPAGVGLPLRNVVALEKSLTATELDTLNSNAVPVNALRSVPGAGICVMGAKTIKPTDADRYVNVRRTLIYLKSELQSRLVWVPFENNDSELWSQITYSLRSFLTAFWQSGGLKGNAPEDAFWIVCDATNNTSSSIQNGEVRVDVGVALQYPAEFVVISLSQITGA